MDEREEVERRLRVLETALGFILSGEFVSVPREQALASERAADHLRRASAGDLMSLVDWLRSKMPYFENRRAMLRDLNEVRLRVRELEDLLAKRASLELGIDARTVPLQRFIPVRVWLDTDDDGPAISVSDAVNRLTQAMGLESMYGYTSERGSRFFRWWTRTKDALTSDEMQERLQKAERAVELAALGRLQADIDQKQAAAAAQLITSLQLIPNAACAVGSILVVKITDDQGPRVVVRTLTQKQMIAIERDDRLMRDPHGLLKYLHELDDASGDAASLDAGLPRET